MAETCFPGFLKYFCRAHKRRKQLCSTGSIVLHWYLPDAMDCNARPGFLVNAHLFGTPTPAPVLRVSTQDIIKNIFCAPYWKVLPETSKRFSPKWKSRVWK